MMFIHPSLNVCLPGPVRRVGPGDLDKWRDLRRVYRGEGFTLTLPPPPKATPFPVRTWDRISPTVVVRDDHYLGWAAGSPHILFLVIGSDSQQRSSASIPNAMWAEDISDALPALVEARAATFGFAHPYLDQISDVKVTWFEPGFSEVERKIIVERVKLRPSLTSVLVAPPPTSGPPIDGSPTSPPPTSGPGDGSPTSPHLSGWVYRSTKGDELFRRNLHRGQRKLFIAELDFLTEAYTRYPELRSRTVRILYVGAAPGIHIPYLSKLFPRISWILVDPGEFFLPGTDFRGKVVRAFFASEADLADYALSEVVTAESLAGKIDFMINDVRNIREESDYFAGEVEKFIALDQAEAIKWLRIVKPRYGASLKNRHPYGVATTTTIRGEVKMQAWAPQSSTETRNFIWVEEGEDPETRYLDEVEVDVKGYEDWCAYYNYCLRGWVSFRTLADRDPFGCTCLDCAHEEHRWRAYVALQSESGLEVGEEAARVAAYVRELTAVIKQPLCTTDHPHANDQGELVSRRKEMYERYIGAWKKRTAHRKRR